MAIVNRDKDVSEQKDMLYIVGATTVSGATLPMAVIPYPCELVSLEIAALVAGSSLQVSPKALRKVSAGITSIAMGTSILTLASFATVGALGFSSLAAAGSSLVQLQQGDILVLDFAGTGGAASAIIANCVVKKLQDIVSYNNVPN